MKSNNMSSTFFIVLIGAIIPVIIEKYNDEITWIIFIIILGVFIIGTSFISWLQDRTKRVKENNKQIRINKKRITKLEELLDIKDTLHKYDKDICILKEKLNWGTKNEKVFKSKKQK